MVDINPLSTSTVTTVTTATLPASPERSTGLTPSYIQLAKDLKLISGPILPARTEEATQDQSSVREFHLWQHLQGWSHIP